MLLFTVAQICCHPGVGGGFSGLYYSSYSVEWRSCRRTPCDPKTLGYTGQQAVVAWDGILVTKNPLGDDLAHFLSEAGTKNQALPVLVCMLGQRRVVEQHTDP